MAKTLLLLLGPNGVGKSTIARALLNILPQTALVDSDWCRSMNPYNRDTVSENIYTLIKNYLLCPDIEIVIFPYGFHGDRKQRLLAVKEKLNKDSIVFKTFIVILICSLEENIRRAENDQRDDERIKRGIKNTHHFYDEFDYPKIDTTNLTVEQITENIISLLKKRRNLNEYI